MRRSKRIASLSQRVRYDYQDTDEGQEDIIEESRILTMPLVLPRRVLASSHQAAHVKPTAAYHAKPRLVDFPSEILENIMSRMDPTCLWHFAPLHRRFLRLLDDERFCEKYTSSQDIPTKEIRDMPFSRFLSLYVGRGCEICKTKRIRTIYWAHRVRCCTNCLHKNTISDYRLQQQKIPFDAYARLPYNTGSFYSERKRCHYLLHFYWRTKVQEALVEYNIQMNQSESDFKDIQAELVQDVEEFMKQVRIQENVMTRHKEQSRFNKETMRITRRENIIERFKSCYPDSSYYKLQYLKSFQDACKLSTPLTGRAWNILYKKLSQEYQEKMVYQRS